MKPDMWFRVYTRVIDNGKLQTMPPELFRALINFWALAKLNDGFLPPAEEIAWRLRLSIDVVNHHIEALSDKSLALLEKRNGRIYPANWDEWQTHKSTSTHRVQAFRNAKRNAHETPDETLVKRLGNAERNARETQNETQRRREEKREPPIVPLFDETPEYWAERLREAHPKPSAKRLVEQFCSDHWYRLGENGAAYQAFMRDEVAAGLAVWAAAWAADGNRFAPALQNWLHDEGWKKAPPKPKPLFDDADPFAPRRPQ